MLKLVIFLLSACIFCSKASAANNLYCSAGLCPQGKPHIACRHNGKFASRCPTNARMISLERFKKQILELHNSKRNLIASGGLAGYRPAKRMATMQWDNELAEMAALNVKQCEMIHDKCRNTRNFSKSGQNLGKVSYSGAETSKSDSMLINDRVNAWFNEYKDCNMRIINKYPISYSGPKIGHFTVFVAEMNIRVGCATSRFKKGQKNVFLLACNYATTNIGDKPIYNSGNAASGCKTGKNPRFSSLCSEAEIYAGLK